MVDYSRRAVFATQPSFPPRIGHDKAGKPGAPPCSRPFAENLTVYAKEAGIEKVHIRQTRHTCARIVADETGSFREMQEALDHKSAAPTWVYVRRITV